MFITFKSVSEFLSGIYTIIYGRLIVLGIRTSYRAVKQKFNLEYEFYYRDWAHTTRIKYKKIHNALEKYFYSADANNNIRYKANVFGRVTSELIE